MKYVQCIDWLLLQNRISQCGSLAGNVSQAPSTLFANVYIAVIQEVNKRLDGACLYDVDCAVRRCDIGKRPCRFKNKGYRRSSVIDRQISNEIGQNPHVDKISSRNILFDG